MKIYRAVETIIKSISRMKAISAGPVVTGNGFPISGAGRTLVNVSKR